MVQITRPSAYCLHDLTQGQHFHSASLSLIVWFGFDILHQCDNGLIMKKRVWWRAGGEPRLIIVMAVDTTLNAQRCAARVQWVLFWI